MGYIPSDKTIVCIWIYHTLKWKVPQSTVFKEYLKAKNMLKLLYSVWSNVSFKKLVLPYIQQNADGGLGSKYTGWFHRPLGSDVAWKAVKDKRKS